MNGICPIIVPTFLCFSMKHADLTRPASGAKKLCASVSGGEACSFFAPAPPLFGWDDLITGEYSPPGARDPMAPT